MVKFDCEKCGKIDIAYIDGYGVGGRTLEGSLFGVKKNDDGTCKIVSYLDVDSKEIDISKWNEDPYFKTLNKEYWVKALEDYASTYDMFECPKCGSDVVPDDLLPLY